MNKLKGGQMRCENCHTAFDDNTGFGLEDWSLIDTRLALCSPSCLVEFAWRLKEAQPKLSKSRQS